MTQFGTLRERRLVPEVCVKRKSLVSIIVWMCITGMQCRQRPENGVNSSKKGVDYEPSYLAGN